MTAPAAPSALQTGGTRPLLYDVFAGAGGASYGYQLAGFRVVGIDINPQPRHRGDGFIQMDAFEFFDRVAAGEFEQPSAWHCSPPCQAYSVTKSLNQHKTYPDLLPMTRERLERTGKPWVIENVPGAPIRSGVQLCGTMFGLRVYRHRWFETSMMLMQPHHPEHVAPAMGSVGHDRKRLYQEEGYFATITGNVGSYCGDAMNIDWMTGKELSQAIPPAYTKWIGEFLMTTIPPLTPLTPARTVFKLFAKTKSYPTLPLVLAEARRRYPGAPILATAGTIAQLTGVDLTGVVESAAPGDGTFWIDVEAGTR